MYLLANIDCSFSDDETPCTLPLWTWRISINKVLFTEFVRLSYIYLNIAEKGILYPWKELRKWTVNKIEGSVPQVLYNMYKPHHI